VQVLVVEIEDPLAAGAERQRRQAGQGLAGLAPEDLAGLGPVGHDRLGRGGALLDPVLPVVPDVRGQAVEDGGVAGHGQQDAVVPEDFLGLLGALVGAERFAGGGVEGGDRRLQAQRHVHAVAHRDEPPGHVSRPGPEVVEGRDPVRDAAFPEQRAVEGVAGDEPPPGRPVDERRVPLVKDGEETAAGGGHGAQAGQGVVVARPLGPRPPPDTVRRPDDRVVGHGVAGGVVEEMCPLVDVLRPRLGVDLRPAAPLQDAGRAARRQDAPHLLHGHVAQVLRHQQVDEVVDVRQPLAVEPVGRDGPVQALRLEMRTGLRDVGGA